MRHLTVEEFKIDLSQWQEVKLPAKAQILGVRHDTQNNKVLLIVLFDPLNTRLKTRHIAAFWNSYKGIPDNATYIGSMGEGMTGFHIFELHRV